jgi:predicted lipoprotein with Yx(FWY)xxD motif
MRRIRFAALLIAFVALLGACAQDEDPAVQAPEETAAASPQTDGIEAATVQVADSDKHGEILVDAEGMTLYAFMKDTADKSNCTDACAQTWPPLVADGDPTAGEGVDEEKLGTIDRDGGDTQVSYNDHPLYTYSPDEKAGDTKGQGVGGNWYVVSADGEPMKAM